MSREEYRERRLKAKAIRQRRAGGKRAKVAQRTIAGAIGCY